MGGTLSYLSTGFDHFDLYTDHINKGRVFLFFFFDTSHTHPFSIFKPRRIKKLFRQMAQQKDFTWGFMLENTLFMEFDIDNHSIIENAYQQKKLKHASHHIIIHDSHLPSEAKIYFGVAQIHLRMPGTRYYVKRKSIPVTIATKEETSLLSSNFSQRYPPQAMHQPPPPQQQQYNPRRRHSQTHNLTRRSSSNNHLYQSAQQKRIPPVPSQSVSLTYPLSASSSAAAMYEPIVPSSSTLMPFTPPFVASSSLDYATSASFSTPTHDAFTNLCNLSWLDSLYATSTTSSMQALLIPWSTTPPPVSSTMINRHIQ
jgi:hypothetical protein